MEFSRAADGTTTPLARKNIDTGMGLERMAQILQDKPNNYETDLIRPIIDKAASMAGMTYASASDAEKLKLKVIGDHVRAVSYLISDGVYPSNVGRGHVVRRLIRRVVRCGRLLGVAAPEGTEAFTPAIAAIAIEMGDACDPELKSRAAKVFDELEREELRFATTLGRGEEILADMLAAAVAADAKAPVLSGDDAFTLYDTYGFPLDITTDVASEAGVTVDVAGFETAMETARNLSRDARASPSTSPPATCWRASPTSWASPPASPATARWPSRTCACARSSSRARAWTRPRPGTPSTSSWTRRRSTPRAAARSATRARSSWRAARRLP